MGEEANIIKLYKFDVFSTGEFGDQDCVDTTFYKAKKPEDIVNVIDWSQFFGNTDKAKEATWIYESHGAHFDVPYEGYPSCFIYAGAITEISFTPIADGVYEATAIGE